MFLTEKIDLAIKKATLLHQGQTRKGSETPYIVHPYAVAFLLAHHTNDEDVIIAGLLHDVLEDVPTYSADDMRKDFGERVTSIVLEVTEVFTKAEQQDHALRRASWKMRKDNYLNRLQTDSKEALLVVMADKIHNIRSLLHMYQTSDSNLSQYFNANIDNLLWFYGEVVRITRTRLDHPLVDELQKTFEEVRDTLVQKRIF
ncbi:MAG: HD domain-containing protein [Minisyncoccota bacterium]